jgi:hypothetical protein
MAKLRRTLLALFALVAACGAMAAQAAPVVMPVAIDQPAVTHACHCDADCDTAACITLSSCAQACLSVVAFLGAAENIIDRPLPSVAILSDIYGTQAGHDWPPPLHPPRL